MLLKNVNCRISKRFEKIILNNMKPLKIDGLIDIGWAR